MGHKETRTPRYVAQALQMAYVEQFGNRAGKELADLYDTILGGAMSLITEAEHTPGPVAQKRYRVGVWLDGLADELDGLLQDPEACPGCGAKPGHGYTPGCVACKDTERELGQKN